jgi:hypothetical protein
MRGLQPLEIECGQHLKTPQICTIQRVIFHKNMLIPITAMGYEFRKLPRYSIV